MAIGDLFKSKQEREREARGKRRKAFREAENAVDAVKDRVKKLKGERDKAWSEARVYLKDGQKAASQRCLQTVRASEVMMAKLETKKWVFEQLLTKLDMAKTDQEFTGALGAINAVVKIDPEAVADVLGEVEDKLGDQVDTDKIWEKMHEKEMEGTGGQMTDSVPSVDQMFKDLEGEVAAQIGEERPATSKVTSGKDGGLKEEIGEGRRRLKDLLEGEK
jgi:vacuolar-type H+-ATPase subunit H